MNFLQLAQRLGRECGVAGSVPSVTQTGEYQRLVDWTNQAWVEIQLERDWNFRHADMIPDTLVIGTQKYAPVDLGITDFESWDIGSNEQANVYSDVRGETYGVLDSSIRLYRLSTDDEQVLPFLPYKAFRSIYQVGTQTNSRPSCFSVDRDNALLFGPIPDYAYTINAAYVKDAAEMTSNADVPGLPSGLHMMIVYKAMQHYGLYEAANEVVQRGISEYARLHTRLSKLELPRVTDDFGALA